MVKDNNKDNRFRKIKLYAGVLTVQLINNIPSTNYIICKNDPSLINAKPILHLFYICVKHFLWILYLVCMNI